MPLIQHEVYHGLNSEKKTCAGWLNTPRNIGAQHLTGIAETQIQYHIENSHLPQHGAIRTCNTRGIRANAKLQCLKNGNRHTKYGITTAPCGDASDIVDKHCTLQWCAGFERIPKWIFNNSQTTHCNGNEANHRAGWYDDENYKHLLAQDGPKNQPVQKLDDSTVYEKTTNYENSIIYIITECWPRWSKTTEMSDHWFNRPK